MHKLKKGLDLPISGAPEQKIQSTPHISKVAVLGVDYVGMKPTMLVREGDSVKQGTPLFTDKKNPGVIYTSPASGKVVEVNRGEKRALQSVVVAVSGQDYLSFPKIERSSVERASADEIEKTMVESGLWTLLRTRPYSRIPALGSRPQSIFINAMETNPLGYDVNVVMQGQEAAFELGTWILSRLQSRVFICHAPQTKIPAGLPSTVKTEQFSGPHPAGLSGTHIHYLDPVGKGKMVWWLDFQDVINIGRSFSEGRLVNERVISLSGPAVKNPGLVKVPTGASLADLTKGRLEGRKPRIVSGSLFCGRTAHDALGYLGAYHHQVVCLEEGDERVFLGWQRPGMDKFSLTRIFASHLAPGKKFEFNTSTEGSMRAMVPIGSYDRVMPLDIEPVFLLRALLSRDTERAQELGALELDEEDLGLCTYVCPTKEDYGPILRENLTKIEKDG